MRLCATAPAQGGALGKLSDFDRVSSLPGQTGGSSALVVAGGKGGKSKPRAIGKTADKYQIAHRAMLWPPASNQ